MFDTIKTKFIYTNLLRRLQRSTLVLMLGVTMNACSSTENWKEEVQLSDGRIIVVERKTLHEGGGDEWASNRRGTKPKERFIRFAHPDGTGQMIEWHSTKKSPNTWPEKPLILDMEAGQPIVFSIVAISIGCEIYSKYLYRDGAWIEEVLPEKFDQRTTNLFIRDGTDMPRFVDLETKRKGNAEIGYRQSLTQVGPTRKVCG